LNLGSTETNIQILYLMLFGIRTASKKDKYVLNIWICDI